VHLHLVLAHLGAVKAALAHQRRLGEARLDLAQLEEDVALDIALTMGMELDGAGRRRLARGEIGGQLLHLQLDELHRLGRGRIVDRRHRRDRLAAIAHALARQRMLGARDRQHAESLVAIGAGDDGDDSGQRRRCRDIDLEDLGVGIGAAKDAARQRAGLDEIGGVFGAARNLLRPVDHRHIAADRAGGRDLAHGVAPAARSRAACCTASMILT
jgi:hypothetical protein